jgi:hypothetical protein
MRFLHKIGIDGGFARRSLYTKKGREPDRAFLVNIQHAENTEALETGVIGIFRNR